MNNVSLFALLWRVLFLRHWLRYPGQTMLVTLLLAVGVASFLSIRLANRAAVASFQNFTDTLTGQSDWIIQPTAGELRQEVLRELRLKLGERPVHILPVVEGTARAMDSKGTLFNLIGIDVIALANVAVDDADRKSDTRSTLWRAMRDKPQAWTSETTARHLGTKIDLALGGRSVTVEIAGSIPNDEGNVAFPDDLLAFDLEPLQELLGREGRLDRVEFLVESGPRRAERSEEVRQLLEELGENRWTVQSPGARRETGETMTRAFRLNLTVLSLIALLVGIYLIGQTLDGSVVRRRPEIATLRALGVTESWIRGLWLCEAALLGAMGSSFGIVLGWLGAQGAVLAVGRTINALYFNTTVTSARLDAGEVVIALLAGIGATVVASLWPSGVAARTPPAQLLNRSTKLNDAPRRQWTLPLFALGLVVAGGLLSTLPPLRFEGGTRFPLAGYITALCWIVGGGLWAGEVLRLLPRMANLGRTVTGQLGLSQFRRLTTRHRIAVAGLVCAVGMTSAMAILVDSFESSVRGWINQSLKADLYIAATGGASAAQRQRLSPSTVETIARIPGVKEAAPLSIRPITINGARTQLSGGDIKARIQDDLLLWVSRPASNALFEWDKVALASETFMNRFALRAGDQISLPTPKGNRQLRIIGVFSDYGSEEGSLVADLSEVTRWFDDPSVTNLALNLRDDVSASRVRGEILGKFPGLVVYENSALRGEVLRIFRQTFSITYALEIIGVIVAVSGLGLTLASMLVDRRDEATTLRALGLTRRELARAAAWEGFFLAAVSTLSGIALSLGLGALLVYVINRQSFGWTLQFTVPVLLLLGLVVAVIAAGTAVAYLVGRRTASLAADRTES